jgi:hypothetical protein
MANQVVITPDALSQSAAKYRKELLMMAVIALEATLNHVTLRTGVRGKETVGELAGTIQLGPYSETRTDTSDVTAKGRTLETFMGSVIKKFSPNSVANSIYGSAVLSGEGLKSADITNLVVAYLSKQVSKTLNQSIFSAVRNGNGNTTADLFNGWDTITATEITAGNIAVGKGNLYEFTEAIDNTNAVDMLKAFYESSDDVLQDETTKLFLPRSIYNAYNKDYQQTVGAAPYNKEFKKTFLEGSDDKCELVPLVSKKSAPYLQLTTKTNMLVGVDQMGDVEKITVEKHHPFVLDFVMAMYFGTEYESISKEALNIGKIYVAP